MTRQSIATALFVTALPTLAAASPITIQYVADVYQFCLFENSTGAPTLCSDPNLLIPFSLTYDDTLTSSNNTANSSEVKVGSVSFSGLSQIPTVPAPLGATASSQNEIAAFSGESAIERIDGLTGIALNAWTGPLLYDAVSNSYQSSVFFDQVLINGLSSIFAPQDELVAPLSAGDLEARLRGSLGPLQIYVESVYVDLGLEGPCESFPGGGFACQGAVTNSFAPGSAAFFANVTPVVAAVPEPASLLLLGSGAAFLAYRRRRSQRS